MRHKVIDEEATLKRVRDIEIDYPYQEAFFQFGAKYCKKTLSGRLPARSKCIDAVQSAVAKSFDEGCRTKSAFLRNLLRRRICARCVTYSSPNARPPKISDVPQTRFYDDQACWCYRRQARWAADRDVFCHAGIPVILVDAAQAALDRGLARSMAIQATVKKGPTHDEAAKKRMR